MAIYTKRIQAVLTEEQHRSLIKLAKEQHRPISELVREAIDTVYFGGSALERRRAALKELLALEAPIADWEAMEREIIKGALAE